MNFELNIIKKPGGGLPVLMFSLLLCLLLLPAQATAQDGQHSDKTPDKTIDKRVEELEKNQAELYHSLKEKKRPDFTNKLSEKLSLGALIEIEAFVENNGRDGDTSDITLATVELGLDADIHKHVTGRVLLLWEEDDTEPMDVDEGFITITSPYGLSITAGKLYVPFGVFNSHFISDPQTLELGETRQSAVVISYAADKFEFSVGAFNGDVDQAGNNDQIDNYVASLTITPIKGSLQFGASYISDIADTNGDITGPTTAGTPVTDEVEGVSVFINLTLGHITIDGEYLAATDKLAPADLDQDMNAATKERPETFNIEAAVAIGKQIEAAIKYEGNNDFPDFPEEQFGGAVSYALFENVSVSAEYLRGSYDTGEDRDVLTTQIAVMF